jgi:PKD repeat protein
MSGFLNLDEGSHPFEIQLTDSIGYQVKRQYTLVVGEPPVILDKFLVNPTYNEAYSFTPSVDGSTPISVSITVTAGTLPTGLSIVGSTIVGTPTVDGQSCQITITAFNDYDKQGVSKVFTLGVYSVPHINTISPLPNATLGSEYDLPFSVSGTKPITIEYLSGDLPPGLTLSTNGKLIGIPSEIGVYTFAVKASNELSNDVQLFTLSVYAPPVITTTLLGYARLGNIYSAQLTATGSDPITYSMTSGSLPLGLSLNQNTGVISGTTLASGTFTFTIVASNIVGNSEPKTFSIEAGLAIAITTTSPLRSGTVNVAYGNLQLVADGLDASYGTETWAWVAASGSALPSGLVLNATTGIISGTPTMAGIYTVNITVINGPNSSTSPFTIEIGTPPVITTTPELVGGVDRPFTIVLQASGKQPITYRMVGAPSPTSNIQLDSNGSLYWLIPEIGIYQFQAIATNSFGDSVPVTFSLTITTPAIIDTALEVGVVGETYLHQFAASGAPPFTWSLIGNLPSGLFFDAATATISGVPTTTGTTSFEVKAVNLGGFAQETFRLTIYARPNIITPALNSGNVNAGYSQILQASGTTPITYQLTSGTLPPGLSLVGATILGTPTTEGDYIFTIRAQNLLGIDFADQRQFQITILPSGAPVITTGARLSGTREIAYTLTLAANGNQPITWNLDDTLPDGLSIDNNVISGIPTVAGVYNFTITATNSNGSDSRTFTLTLADPPVITKISLADGITNAEYLDTLTADGDTPRTWSVLAPTGSETEFPPGLVLGQTTGIISGIPTASGTYTFRVRVINSSGTDTKTFTMTITSLSATFVNGKEIGSLFIRGKEISEAYVGGKLVYKC